MINGAHAPTAPYLATVVRRPTEQFANSVDANFGGLIDNLNQKPGSDQHVHGNIYAS